MGKLRWYKRDPVAALEGMSNLSLEEKGAYNVVLDLIYARDGAVDDDPRFIAGWLRCDLRVWKRIRARLIELEKLYVADGKLRNSRADAEVDRGLQMVASASEAGKASARKKSDVKSKNKDIGLTTVAATVATNSTPTTTTTEDKKEVALRAPVDVSRETNPSGWPVDAFEQFWHKFPHRVGKQAAVKAFAKAKRAAPPWQKIITALEHYIASKPADRSWCNPATWLNDGRWDDEPAANGGSNGQRGSRPLQDDSKSISAAAGRLAEAAERGEFTFGPRPSLLPEPNEGPIFLLSKG